MKLKIQWIFIKKKTNEQFSLKSSIKFSHSQSTISVIHVKPQIKTKSVIKLKDI
jgi:hypothetical protein